MSSYLAISGQPGTFSLTLRAPRNGIGTDYRRLCGLSDAEAAALAASGLIHHLYAAEIPDEAGEVTPAKLLTLRRTAAGGLEVQLHLPAAPALERAVIDIALPDISAKLTRRLRNGEITATGLQTIANDAHIRSDLAS